VQELHLVAVHMVCEAFDAALERGWGAKGRRRTEEAARAAGAPVTARGAGGGPHALQAGLIRRAPDDVPRGGRRHE
jgi:D-sedoheptulose 7-phosphate isomerase